MPRFLQWLRRNTNQPVHVDEDNPLPIDRQRITGTWDCRVGTSGQVSNIPTGARILQITASNVSGSASIDFETSSGAKSMPVPAGFGASIVPEGNPTIDELGGTITFVSTDGYLVEFVT